MRVYPCNRYDTCRMGTVKPSDAVRKSVLINEDFPQKGTK